MCDDIKAAVRLRVDEALARVEEATLHPKGLERAVEAAMRDLSRAVMEGAILMRSERLTEAPECCPDCGGSAMRVLRESPPESGDGGGK